MGNKYNNSPFLGKTLDLHIPFLYFYDPLTINFLQSETSSRKVLQEYLHPKNIVGCGVYNTPLYVGIWFELPQANERQAI